jgi:pilus assembly protein CpaB
MKAARLVVLGIAVTAGGLAAYLAAGSKASPPPPPPEPVAQLQTVDVLVAKSDLSRGQVISEKDIGWQSWPADSTGSSFVKKTDKPDAIQQYVGAFVREAIPTGEPIREPAVAFAKGSGFMAATLTPGMRAASIEMSQDSGVILPEDHIDIVLTRHDKEVERDTGTEKFVSETILKNVRVLQVTPKIVTVELNPQQVEKLALSRQQGTITFTLRSIVDSQSSTPEDDGDRPRCITMVRFGVTRTCGIF